MNFTRFEAKTIFSFLLSPNHSANPINSIPSISLEHQPHQRQSARSRLHHAPAETLPAQVEISSKEKPRRQRRHLAQTEPELDPEECGDSTLTTAPESKCKWFDHRCATGDLFRFILVAQFQCSWCRCSSSRPSSCFTSGESSPRPKTSPSLQAGSLA